MAKTIQLAAVMRSSQNTNSDMTENKMYQTALHSARGSTKRKYLLDSHEEQVMNSVGGDGGFIRAD